MPTDPAQFALAVSHPRPNQTEAMVSTDSRVTIHLAASLDGFIARKDGSVDWMETSDEFASGETMDHGFIEAFLKTIDCYVMGSRTYETALSFEAEGLGWAYGDKPTFVLTHRESPRIRILSSSIQAISRSLLMGASGPGSVASGLLEAVWFPANAFVSG